MPGPWRKSAVTVGLKQLLQSDGIIDDAATLTPLSGGVSSEIVLVRNGDEQFVAKRALPRLKVAEPWFADVSRNRNEAKYLQYVGAFLPRNVPRLLFASVEHGYFCMEYLGEDWQNWKTLLLSGRVDPSIAGAAATLLGTVHAHSSCDFGVPEQFDTLTAFEQLRIEPYLLTTARRHPALKGVIGTAAGVLRSRREVLVHGDFSPKNILVRSGNIMVLDCEVAWFGNAAFDVAFLMSHLLLKSLLSTSEIDVFQSMAASAWSSYLKARNECHAEVVIAELGSTVSHLLLILLLARMDGKSTVEYLSELQREYVRQFTIKYLHRLPMSVEDLAAEWFDSLKVVSMPVGRSLS